MESDYHWLITIGLVTSSVIAVTANFFLLIVFCRRRGLRTVPNRFVINLLVTNLLSSILLIPLLLVDQPRNPSVLLVTSQSTPNTTDDIVLTPDNSTDHRLLCYLAQSTTGFVCTASIFSVLLIGVNQYFGVIHSLRYHFYVNKCRSTILIASSWCVALLCAALGALAGNGSGLWRSCDSEDRPMGKLATAYAFGYFFFVILTPFVAICVIYVCIYTAAHQNSERMRRSTSAPLSSYLEYARVSPPSPKSPVQALPKVRSAPNFFNVDREQGFKVESECEKPRAKVARTCSDRIAHSFIGNLKHKISNASVFRYREETRAAKISVLVILMVMVCYVPYGLTLVLGSQRVRAFDCVSLALLVFSNVLSPFLFGYRNKRVKREICKMFGLLPRQALPFGERPTRRASPEFQIGEPFIPKTAVPQVVVTETERKSILKRVCNPTGWASYKKCNFIAVPDSCIGGEARGSFSSASTQISTEE